MNTFAKKIATYMTLATLSMPITAMAEVPSIPDVQRELIDALLSSKKIPSDQLFEEMNLQVENFPVENLVYRADVVVSSIEGFGVSPEDIAGMIAGTVEVPAEGLRIDMDFSGTVNGRINGTLNGTDHLTINPGGRMDLDIRGVIETDDGHKIALSAIGTAVLQDGENTFDITERASLSTSAEPYLWVNDVFILGGGPFDSVNSSLNLQLFEF